MLSDGADCRIQSESPHLMGVELESLRGSRGTGIRLCNSRSSSKHQLQDLEKLKSVTCCNMTTLMGDVATLMKPF